MIARTIHTFSVSTMELSVIVSLVAGTLEQDF